MKTKIKALGMIAFVALGLGVVTTNVDFTKSAEASEAAAKFEMDPGAAVRMPTQEEQAENIGSGIRFSSRINEKYVTDNFASATNVTLYSKVESASNPEQNFVKSWVLKGENAIELEYNASGEAKFYHAIMFDSLINSTAGNAEELMAQASALDLKGTMWLEVDGEEVQADNAATVDTTRSARIVAYTAYQANNNLTGLDKYATLDSTITITAGSDNQAYFEENKTSESEELSMTFGANALYDLDLYDGMEKIGVNKDLTASDFEDGLGSTKTLLGFDDENNVYTVPAMYVTKAIKESSDLSVLNISEDNDYVACTYGVDTETGEPTLDTCELDGYFVLANDIAYDETWAHNEHPAASTGKPARGFVGTFDGRGHTMTIDISNGGVFGNICTGSTVKNVGIIVNEIEKTSGNCGVMAHCTTSGTCYMDNIYLKANLVDNNTYAISVSGGRRLNTNNMIIEASCASDRASGILFFTLQNANETKASMAVHSEAFLITNNETAPLVTYSKNTTNYQVYATNDGQTEDFTVTPVIRVYEDFRRYTSLSAMKADTENVIENEFNSYWETGLGAPLWKTAVSVEISGVEDGSILVGSTATIKATCEGLDVEIESITSGDEDVLTVNDKTLTAAGVGETTYRVVYVLGNKRYSQTLSVVCACEEVTKADVVEYFSASDGVFDLSLLSGETASQVLKATQLVDGEEVELTVSAGVNGELIITGVTPNIVTGSATTYTSTVNKYTGTTAPGSATNISKSVSDRTVAPTQITIYTNQKTYIFTNVMAYTKVLDEASDWTIFNTATDGYYILKTDIDFAGATFTAEDSSLNFAGVIDGNGKTVKNFSTAGLLGRLSGGIVKDIAFNGTVTDAGLFGAYVHNTAMISNVYMSLTLSQTGAYAFADNIKDSVWKNVIIELQNGATQASERVNKNELALGLLAAAVSSSTQNKLHFENVKVITKDNTQTGITIDDDVLVSNTTSYNCYASGDTGLLTEGEMVNWVYAGITRYEDKATAQTVGNWTVAQDGSITWTEA